MKLNNYVFIYEIYSSFIYNMPDPFTDGINEIKNAFEDIGHKIVEIDERIKKLADDNTNIMSILSNFPNLFIEQIRNIGHMFEDFWNNITGFFTNTLTNFFICLGNKGLHIILDVWYSFLSVELCGWLVYSVVAYPHCIFWWIQFSIYYIIKIIINILEAIIGIKFIEDFLSFLKSVNISWTIQGVEYNLTKYPPEVACKCFTTGNLKYVIIFMIALVPLNAYFFAAVILLEVLVEVINASGECNTGSGGFSIPFLDDDFILQLPHWKEGLRMGEGIIDDGYYYDCAGLGFQGCDNSTVSMTPKTLSDSDIENNEKNTKTLVGILGIESY